MNYKLSDAPLKLREFGRNVQSMVDYAKSIEDKDKRNVVANEIIRIMSNLTPNVKDIPDYKQKLWDALFLISGYDFDVDAPYPLPERPENEGQSRPRMEYYSGRPRYKQYGYNIHLMIKKAVEMEDGEEKEAMINQIANTMKLFLKTLDRDSAQEEVIAQHITEISRGKLSVQPEDLTLNKIVLNPPLKGHSTPSKSGRNNNKNHKRKSNKGGRRRK